MSETFFIVQVRNRMKVDQQDGFFSFDEKSKGLLWSAAAAGGGGNLVCWIKETELFLREVKSKKGK
jgi:hypothetical protein